MDRPRKWQGAQPNDRMSAAESAVSVSMSYPDAVTSLPLGTWMATNGAWDSGGGQDFRSVFTAKSIGAGTGVAVLNTGPKTLVGVDTAVVPMYLAGMASLDFSSIGAGNCAELTFPLTGAVPGDALAAGWPAGIQSGLIGTMRVSANGVIGVSLCNLSGVPVDPPSSTYRAVIVRSF